MSYTCIVCQEDFLNPYEVFCGKNFRTTDSQTLCRFYICANCTATPNLLKNGCPNCHEKGLPKFVPPGYTDLVMESRPEPKQIVQHVPDLGGVQDSADFSENPAVVTGKRQTKQTNFYQPEHTKNKNLWHGSQDVKCAEMTLQLGFVMQFLAMPVSLAAKEGMCA